MRWIDVCQGHRIGYVKKPTTSRLQPSILDLSYGLPVSDTQEQCLDSLWERTIYGEGACAGRRASHPSLLWRMKCNRELDRCIWSGDSNPRPPILIRRKCPWKLISVLDLITCRVHYTRLEWSASFRRIHVQVHSTLILRSPCTHIMSERSHRSGEPHSCIQILLLSLTSLITS